MLDVRENRIKRRRNKRAEHPERGGKLALILSSPFISARSSSTRWSQDAPGSWERFLGLFSSPTRRKASTTEHNYFSLSFFLAAPSSYRRFFFSFQKPAPAQGQWSSPSCENAFIVRDQTGATSSFLQDHFTRDTFKISPSPPEEAFSTGISLPSRI